MDMKSLKVKNKSYKIMVEMYKINKNLKISLIDDENHEKIELTINDIELTYTEPLRPDCVLINTEKYKDILDEMVKLKILDYYTLFYSKFNLLKLCEYDLEGVQSFLDSHMRRAYYREDKGKSLKEVRQNLIQDATKVLKDEKVINSLHSTSYITDVKNLDMMYALVNTYNYKDSVVFYEDLEGDCIFLISPYFKYVHDKVYIVEEDRFSFKEGLFYFLQDGFEINSIRKDLHKEIWNEIEIALQEDMNDCDYYDEIVKYLEYCKKENLNCKTINLEEKKFRNTLEIYKKITN